MRIITFLALAGALAMGQTASAERLVETRAFYSTNADGAVGKAGSVTIDDNFSDWSEDQIISTCGANDMATCFKGSHENNVLDTYALFASWDDENLYIAWQMCNTGDTWARPGDGPLTDYGHIRDVPLVVALSVDPSKPGMTGLLENGNAIWTDSPGHGTTFDPAKVHVDNLLFMSGQPGLGTPALFTASNAAGATNYNAACHNFASNGIKYSVINDFLPSHLWRQRTCADWADATTLLSDPSIVENIYDAENYDNLLAGPVAGLKPHSKSYDSFFEIQIPFKALGITREWLENNGIGVRVIGTRGESAIDCIPFDPSMVDNVFKEYAKDPSTTGEKDDLDVITYAMADVAKIRDLNNIEPLPFEPFGQTPDPGPGPGPEPNDGNYTIYYDNSNTNWSSVKTWIWDANEGDKNYTGGSWPGADMTKDAETGYYKYSFTCNNTNPNLKCIFNNGSAQTDDLDLVNNGVYTNSGFTGQTVLGVSAPEAEVKYFIHGLTVETPNGGALYNLQGLEIATGTTLCAPAAGLYIIYTEGRSIKVALR